MGLSISDIPSVKNNLLDSERVNAIMNSLDGMSLVSINAALERVENTKIVAETPITILRCELKFKEAQMMVDTNCQFIFIVCNIFDCLMHLQLTCFYIHYSEDTTMRNIQKDRCLHELNDRAYPTITIHITKCSSTSVPLINFVHAVAQNCLAF